MKRVVTIVLLSLVVASCEKALIRPVVNPANATDCDPTSRFLNAPDVTTNPNTPTESSAVISTTGTGVCQPDTLDNGTITDPIKKKDEKDRKANNK